MPRKKRTSSKKAHNTPHPSASPSNSEGVTAQSEGDTPQVEEQRNNIPMVPFLIVIVSQWIWRYATNRAYITCLPDQQLVTLEEDYLPVDEFQELQRYVTTHRLLREYDESIALNSHNFDQTSGFVVRFNLDGLQQMKQHTDLAGLSNYVDYVKSRGSNAFVLNVLVCPASETYLVPTNDNEPNEDINDTKQIEDEGEKEGAEDGDEKEEDEEEKKELFDFGESVVGIHLDDTAGLGPHWLYPAMLDWAFLAHQVNVLYVKLPKDMVGGQLDIWPHMGGRKPVNGTNPYTTITPEENLMIEFRGDAFHRVRAFNSDSEDSPRISIVLEQYRIPSGHYDRTVEFEFVKDSDHRQYI